jgi:uncharacterized protein DUF3592
LDTRRQPSIVSLILADYASLLCFLFPVIAWGMFAAAVTGLWPSKPAEAEFRFQFCLWLAIAATVVGGPLLYLRIRNIRSILRDGIAVPAKVVSVWFMKDRGRVEYEYTFEGQTYRGGMALAKSKRAAELKEGQEITVLVHPANPGRSMVADVFG